jgi:hypothetical protein
MLTAGAYGKGLWKKPIMPVHITLNFSVFSIVNHWTANNQAETGKGYYECLVKRAEKIQEDDSQSDAALKQIDLDLIRTLPNNRWLDCRRVVV